MNTSVFEFGVMTTSLSQYPYANWLLEYPTAIQHLQDTAAKNRCGLDDVFTFLRTLDRETLYSTIEQLSTMSPDDQWLAIPYALPGDAENKFLCKKPLFENPELINRIIADRKEHEHYVCTKHWPYVELRPTMLKIQLQTRKIFCKINKKLMVAMLVALFLLFSATAMIVFKLSARNVPNNWHGHGSTETVITTTTTPNCIVSMPTPYVNVTVVDWRNRSSFYTQRKPPITMIVLHDGTASTAQETLDILTKQQLSVHYIVEKNGTIYYLVDESNRAWHAGLGSWAGFNDVNSVSIGIEVVGLGNGSFPREQIQSVGKLCKQLVSKYCIKPKNIIGAYDSAPTRVYDPSGYFDWKLFNSIVGIYPKLFDSQLSVDQQQQVLLHTISHYDSNVEIMQQQLTAYGYGFTSVDGVFLHNTALIVQAFNRHFCTEIFHKETVIGNQTIPDERNQCWYRLSQERLDYLLLNQH